MATDVKKKKEHLCSIVDFYKKKLGIEGFIIEVMLSDDKRIISNRFCKSKRIRSENWGETTSEDYRGHEYTIVLNKSIPDSEVKEIICHELLHVLFWKCIEQVESVIKLSDFPQDKQDKILQDIWDKEHVVIDKLLNIIK